MERQYTEKEAEAILKLAASKSPGVTGVPQSRLVQMAAELGIPEDQLRLAAQEYELKAAEEAEWQAFRKEARNDLWSHLGIYLAVNVFLLIIDLAKDRHLDWGMWPALGWGIGVVAHILHYCFASESEQRKEFNAWRGKRSEEVRPELRKTLDEIALHEPSKIEAIKLLRERRGLSLAEAKSAVDAYDAENGKVFL